MRILKILRKVALYVYTIIYRCLIKFNKNNKVALCCIAKCENDYINEFINYYKQLGVDKIFIYDNNDFEGEDLPKKIKSEIDLGFCEVIDYRGKKKCQLEAYQECYDKYKNEFGWFLFFDCDEYLTLKKHKFIKEYLSQKQFKKFQIIHINWMVYGDNDLLFNDGRGVLERFRHPIYPYDFVKDDYPENNLTKSIIRGGLKEINWVHNPHTPYSDKMINRCCNSVGKECNPNYTLVPFDFTIAYIRHYCTKTISEWILIKQKRGYPDQYDNEIGSKLDIDVFFKYNRWTEEKQEIVNKYKNKTNK